MTEKPQGNSASLPILTIRNFISQEILFKSHGEKKCLQQRIQAFLESERRGKALQTKIQGDG